MNNLNIIEAIKTIIRAKFPSFKGIYFFGSQINGAATAGSDYDLAVIFDEKVDWKFKDKVVDCIYDFMIENDLVLDIHVYSEGDFYMLDTPFKMNIKEKGIYIGV